jgi:two-component system sensor histidine kinase ChiS
MGKIILDIESQKHTDDYRRFSLIVVLASIICLFFYTFYSLYGFKKNNQNTLKIESQNIALAIADAFNYANLINTNIGKEIANGNVNDLKNILAIFKKNKKIYDYNKDLFSWSAYDFVNNKNLQLVNSMVGIRKKPPNMSNRKYSELCKKKPWTLQVSTPNYGNPSGIWTIPAGTGFEDKNGNYLGIISIGFEIEKLRNQVIKKINDNDVSFVILDYNGNIILQSLDNSFSREDNYFKLNPPLKILKNKSKSNGKINIKVNNINFSYFQIIENYNYLVLTGFNYKFLYKEFYNQVINFTLFFAFITIFFLIILYIFKIRIFKILNQEKNLARSLHISNSAKSNLIRATSHDLKNYLFSISGITKLLLKEKNLTNDNIELLKIIDEQSDDLALFLEDLLDINQQDHEPINPNSFGKHNINEIITRIVLLNKSLALKYKIKINENFEKNLPMIYCDLRRIKQIFNNLVNNSIKYSYDNSSIDIITKVKNNKIIAEIIDHGIGMTQEEISLALEGKYHLIDKKLLNRETSSYGIGLKNVQELIKINNGILEIESKKNEGSIFRLIFNVSNHKAIEVNNIAYKKLVTNNNKHKKIILIVDDNLVNIKITSTVLQRAGYIIKTAYNGLKALEILDEEHIDLIIMDGEMPELNGFEATKIIRSGNRFKNFKDFKTIPIIGLMGNSDNIAIKESYASGMNYHICKARSTKEILDAIGDFI